MRTKDMETGTIGITGRGFNNRIVVIVRPETWSLKRHFYGARSHEFSKGKGGAYQSSNGVLAIETPIHTGSTGYFYDIDFDDKKIKKQIARAVAEAKRLAALSDEELIAEINVGTSIPTGKYGQVDVINPANITHSLEEFQTAIAAQIARRAREKSASEERAERRASNEKSIKASLAALGIDVSFSVDDTKVTFFGATDLAEALAKVAASK